MRQEGLNSVSSQLEKISERLNDQQAAMHTLQDEKQELHKKLQEMRDVAVKSEDLRQRQIEVAEELQAQLKLQVSSLSSALRAYYIACRRKVLQICRRAAAKPMPLHQFSI